MRSIVSAMEAPRLSSVCAYHERECAFTSAVMIMFGSDAMYVMVSVMHASSVFECMRGFRGGMYRLAMRNCCLGDICSVVICSSMCACMCAVGMVVSLNVMSDLI